MRSKLREPLAPSVIGTVAYGIWLAVYSAYSRVPPEFAITLFPMALAVLFLVGWELDARRSRTIPCFDAGLLAILGFPFSVFWYSWRYSRQGGRRVILTWLFVWFGPVIISACLFPL